MNFLLVTYNHFTIIQDNSLAKLTQDRFLKQSRPSVQHMYFRVVEQKYELPTNNTIWNTTSLTNDISYNKS